MKGLQWGSRSVEPEVKWPASGVGSNFNRLWYREWGLSSFIDEHTLPQIYMRLLRNSCNSANGQLQGHNSSVTLGTLSSLREPEIWLTFVSGMTCALPKALAASVYVDSFSQQVPWLRNIGKKQRESMADWHSALLLKGLFKKQLLFLIWKKKTYLNKKHICKQTKISLGYYLWVHKYITSTEIFLMTKLKIRRHVFNRHETRALIW